VKQPTYSDVEKFLLLLRKPFLLWDAPRMSPLGAISILLHQTLIATLTMINIRSVPFGDEINIAAAGSLLKCRMGENTCGGSCLPPSLDNSFRETELSTLPQAPLWPTPLLFFSILTNECIYYIIVKRCRALPGLCAATGRM